MSSNYVPERGDVVWMDFDPQVGREQSGRRPAVILTTTSYNRRVRLALVCPITRQCKGYPFEVGVPEGLPVSGAILADHIKSIDWQVRTVQYAGKLPDVIVNEVLRKSRLLLS